MLLNAGPDQIIPLYGLLGAAAGIALIFWDKLTQGLRMWTAKPPALRKQA